MAGLERRLDDFLFAPVDARVVGAFRVALAGMLALVFWPVRQPLAGPPRQIDWLADLYPTLFLTDFWWALSLIALGSFALGYRVRPVGALLVLLLLPRIYLWGTEMSRQVLLLSLVSFSLLRSGIGAKAPPAGPIWPIRLIQLQLSVVYGVNALSKTTPEYLSGNVLMSFVGVQHNLLVDLSDGFLHLGPLAIPVWLCAVGTAATEYALALGFWFRRTRLATAALGLAFHVALSFVIAIGWLDWTCVFLYLAFLLPFDAQGKGVK